MNVEDEIARLAAVLLARGEAKEVADAIRKAADHLGRGPTSWPSPALVRRHAKAMAEQDLGGPGYRELVRNRLRTAEEVMTILEMGLAPRELWLVGRAARGHVDADPRFRFRYHGDATIGEIASLLVDAGYPEPAFEVVTTRWGRLERVRFRDDGVECIVTRCPPQQVLDSTLDLFSGRPVSRISLEELRRSIS